MLDNLNILEKDVASRSPESQSQGPIKKSPENETEPKAIKENPYFKTDEIASAVSTLVNTLSAESSLSSLKDKLAEQLIARDVVDQDDPRLKQLSQNITEIESSDNSTLAASVTKALAKFLTETVTPEEYEARLREKFVEEHNFSKLNELVSYHRSEDGKSVFIHLAPARTINEIKGMRLFKDGLSVLAISMDLNPELNDVKTVEAISWIVDQKPEIMKHFGFVIDGPIGDADKEAHFSAEENVSRAHMERADFIERYKPKQ